MQIILASAKIMNVSIKREQSKLVCSVEREKRGMKSNDRSATKGDACQSKKVKSSTDISLPSPEPTYAKIYEGDWLDDERLAYQKLIKSCHFQDFFHLGLDVE